MARQRRKKKSVEVVKKLGNGRDFDEKYQYFHLGFLDMDRLRGSIEKTIIDNGIVAEKSVTISGCWSFRWKRGEYDTEMLESIFMLCDHPGMPYLQKKWHFIGVNDENTVKQVKKGRKRRKRA